jgi:hypothetical protein
MESTTITPQELAAELRSIADIFDAAASVPIIKPTLNFYHGYAATKEEFLALAAAFPRPFKKGDGYAHAQYTLTHESAVLEVYASIDRTKVCHVVKPAQPAEFECEPLLSEIEEAALAVE